MKPNDPRNERIDDFAPLMDHLSGLACGCPWLPSSGPGMVAQPPAAQLLSPEAMPDDIEKVAIIGVIDHAIPFAHRNLTTASGHSRVAAIWLQGAPGADPAETPGDIPFGREIRGAGLDALRRRQGAGLVAEEIVYRRTGALGYRDAVSRLSRSGPGLAAQLSHGAAVTGLAAGLPPGDRAERSMPVIAVSLPDHLVADTSGAFAPYFVQAAIIYVVNRARVLARALRDAGRKGPVPLILNLSYGVTAGPRDGSLGLVQLQDLIATNACDDLDPVHFVLPSGNHRLERLHGQISRKQSVLWHLPPDDPTPNVVEIWGPRQKQPRDQRGLALKLTLPGGQSAQTDFGKNLDGISILRAGGIEIARAYRQFRKIKRRQDGEEYWRQCLTLISSPTLPVGRGSRGAPSGMWRIAIAAGPPGPLDIDVQRDDRLAGFPGTRRQSRLYAKDYQPVDRRGHVVNDDPPGVASVLRRRGTSNAYASGNEQLRVGGSVGDQGVAVPDAQSAAGTGVASYAGLLASGLPGDLLAPSEQSRVLSGVRVSGCRSGSGGRMSGTSVAAPQVARWLAEEILAGVNLPDREAVIAHARLRKHVRQGVAGAKGNGHRPPP